MEPGLRTYKQATLRVAVPESLPEHMQPHMREILSVRSGSRQKGEASALMYRTCQEADDACVTLILQVAPFESGLTIEQLQKWYEKFGFAVIQTEPALMMARQVQPNRIKLH
jgi:hypothetical protein